MNLSFLDGMRRAAIPPTERTVVYLRIALAVFEGAEVERLREYAKGRTGSTDDVYNRAQPLGPWAARVRDALTNLKTAEHAYEANLGTEAGGAWRVARDRALHAFFDALDAPREAE